MTTLVVALQSMAGAAALVVAKVVGLAVLSAVVAGIVALVYRWYVRERVPTGLPLLVGLSAIAVSLSTTSLLAEQLAPSAENIELLTALVQIVTFGVGAVAAYGGTRAGDQLAVNLFTTARNGAVDADVSEIVQHVGRVTAVRLPEEIDDIVGYDPVAPATKKELAGRRFLFPRRLSETELRDRLVARLRTDYGVGHVDVELTDGGDITYLAVGSRAAGIGPTLPPATNAVAIRADPANAASAGDLVQVWRTAPFERVLTGELRGVAGDVVTVAIDASDTPKLDPSERYRLVTLPVENRPDREFASLLRAADETMATVTVGAHSSVDGTRVDQLDVTVAAITREGADAEPLPAGDRRLSAGDVVYAIATPDGLRRLEEAARPDESAAGEPAESVSEHGTAEPAPGPEASAPPADPGATESSEPTDDAGDERRPDADEGRSVADDPGTNGDERPTDDAPSGGTADDEPPQADDSSTDEPPTGEQSAEEPPTADEFEPLDLDDELPPDEAVLEGERFPDDDRLEGEAFPEEELPGLELEGEDPWSPESGHERGDETERPERDEAPDPDRSDGDGDSTESDRDPDEEPADGRDGESR